MLAGGVNMNGQESGGPGMPPLNTTLIQVPDWNGNPLLAGASVYLGALALKTLFDMTTDNPAQAKLHFINYYIGKLRHGNDQLIADAREQQKRSPLTYLFTPSAMDSEAMLDQVDKQIDETEDYLRSVLGLPPRVKAKEE